MGEFEEKLNSILSSPKDMERILGLARELSGEAGAPPARPEPEPENTGGLGGLLDMDPRILGILGRVMREYTSAGNDKAALLGAMKPYVREERREALDRAAKIAKIARVARSALTELGGGDLHFDL